MLIMCVSETDITVSDHSSKQPVLDISRDNNAGLVVTNYDGKFVTMRRTYNYIYYLSSFENVPYKDLIDLDRILKFYYRSASR